MRVVREYNPLVLDYDNLVYEVSDSLSPLAIIDHCEFVFTRPVVLLVNGEPVGRGDWHLPLAEGVTVHFVELPRGGGGKSNPLAIVATIALVALSAGTVAMVGAAYGTIWGAVAGAAVMAVGGALVNSFFAPAVATAPIPSLAVSAPISPMGSYGAIGSSGVANLGVSGIGAGQRGKPDTIYSLAAGGVNRIRLGEPFTEHFGRVIVYPDLVQQNYTRIENNDHYLYLLGIIGVGEYEIEGVYIGKTLIEDYRGTQYKILPPGTAPTLVPDIVWSSTELAGQEITTNWLTAIISAAGTSGQLLEFDLVFGGGLIAYNDKVEKRPASVTIRTEIRRVDYYGKPLSDWTLLEEKEYVATEKNPLRFSIARPASLGKGRYAFRVKRMAPVSDDSKVVDRVAIGGVRMYGPRHPDYGKVTMIEVKIKATDQLSGDMAGKINVVATRKLPIVKSSGFGGIESTRSIIDAIAYVITSANGGKQPADILDFESLATLRARLEKMGYHYDWRHTQRSSVIDAISGMAKIGRAVIYMPGGLLSVVQDRPTPLPSQVFSEEDYSEGSFRLAHGLRTDDSPTAVIVSYVNPETWQEESVTCVRLGGSLERPSEIRLEGCTSRQHAYEIGMYLYLDDEMNRTGVEFVTGLKGHLPQPGSRLLVSANMTDWGQTGRVVSVTGDRILLSEPVFFKGESSGQLYLTNSAGAAAGPFSVSPTDKADVVQGLIPGGGTMQDKGMSAMSYVFGPKSQKLLKIRFLGAQMRGQNEIRIVGNIVHDEVYDHPGEAPKINEIDGNIPHLASLEISFLGKKNNRRIYQATWSGSAMEFKVEVAGESGSYSTAEEKTDKYSHQIFSDEKMFSVRVTPYSNGGLETDAAKVKTYTILHPPTPVSTDVNDSEVVKVSWPAVHSATGYNVEIWVDGENKTGRYVAGRTSEIEATDLTDGGGVWRDFQVRVYAIRGHEISDSANMDVTIPPPPAPENFKLVARMSDGVHASWSSVRSAKNYAVWRSTSAGFTPSNSNLVYFGDNTNAAMPCNMTEQYHYHFKVAAVNDFYSHTDTDLLNYSSFEVAYIPPEPLPAPHAVQVVGYDVKANLIALAWTHVPGAVGYRVKQVSRLPPGHTDETLDPTIGGTVVYNGPQNSLTINVPLNHGKVKFAVAAYSLDHNTDSILNWKTVLAPPASSSDGSGGYIPSPGGGIVITTTVS